MGSASWPPRIHTPRPSLEQGDQAWTSDLHVWGRAGGVDCWGARARVKLVLPKVKLDPRPVIRWPGAGGVVPVDKLVASKVSCCSSCRPVMLLLSMLSSLSRQLPEEEGYHGTFDPKHSCHGIYNERHWLSRVIAG